MGLVGIPVLQQVMDSIKSNTREMAVRLGSLTSVQGGGRVILQDDFIDPIGQRWGTILHAGAFVAVSATTAKTGGTSMYVGTNPVVGVEDYVERYTTYNPSNGRFGAEISFTSAESNWQLEVDLRVRPPGQPYGVEGAILFAREAATLSYYGVDGFYHVFAAKQLTDLNVFFWHNIKVVVDVVKDEFVSATLDGFTFDLSGIPLFHSVQIPNNFVGVQIGIIPTFANFQHLYFDAFVLTQDEE